MIIFLVLNTNESSWEIDALSFLKNRAYAFNGRIMRWLKEKLRILISSKKILHKTYFRISFWIQSSLPMNNKLIVDSESWLMNGEGNKALNLNFEFTNWCM